MNGNVPNLLQPLPTSQKEYFEGQDIELCLRDEDLNSTKWVKGLVTYVSPKIRGKHIYYSIKLYHSNCIIEEILADDIRALT